MDENISSDTAKTKKKKFNKLCARIRKQLEFYFSDSNLSKDKFLTDLISKDPNGYVDVEIFKSFNKIKVLIDKSETDSCLLIAIAAGRSKMFEVSADHRRLRRITPVQSKDFDAYTLYVERLPFYATQTWVRDKFCHFGTIRSVNVPRYKATNKVKGFAFIEFENVESVKKASEYYKLIPEKECSASEDENKNIKNVKKNKNEDISDKKNKTRTRSVSESSDKMDFSSSRSDLHADASEKHLDPDNSPQKNKKKRKREDSDSEATTKKPEESTGEEPKTSVITSSVEPKLEVSNLISENKQAKLKEHEASASYPEKMGFSSSKSDLHADASEKHLDPDNSPQKNKKKRKREDSDSEATTKKAKESTDEEPRTSVIASLVEPKVEVSDLVSEDKQAKLKEHEASASDVEKVHDNDVNGTETKEKKSKRRRRKNHHRSNQEQLSLRVMPKTEWKVYRNKYLDLQRSTMRYLKHQFMIEAPEWKEHESYHAKPMDVCEPKKPMDFVPDVIIKVTLLNPIKNSSEVKDQIKSNAVVAYIDAPIESTEVFIRCHNSDDAESIIREEKLSQLGNTELLKGEEEKMYWEKIQNDRMAKYNNPVPHKKRGRCKLMAKIAKFEEMRNKHIFYDD